MTFQFQICSGNILRLHLKVDNIAEQHCIDVIHTHCYNYLTSRKFERWAKSKLHRYALLQI